MESRADRRSRFVLLTQQSLVLGAVLALGVSAAVVELDIVPPTAEVGSAPATTERSVTLRPAAPETDVAEAAPAPVATEAVKPRVRTVTLDQSGTEEPAAGRKSATVSPEVETKGFATVGVTWDPAERLTEDEVQVFVRSRQGERWSGWQEMHYDPAHGPDTGSAEASAAERPGTDAVVVGDVDDVQVKTVTASGETPEGLALAVVDPGTDPEVDQEAPALSATETAEPAQPAQGDAQLSAAARRTTAQPQIFSREQWGADERLRDKSSLRYGTINAGFVHHTVNANDYTKADVPAIIRGIYAYHTKSRGWSDVGYNFLIDRFGRIWEGRYGGISRAVVGAHTLGYNDYSFAASAIGNFETAKPSAAVIDAYARLFAWKLSLHDVRPDSTRQKVGSDYFKAINGHRDAGQTACPGRHLYARIPDIRTAAAAYQGTLAPRPLTRNLSGLPWPDLVVRDRATRKGYVVRTAGQVGFTTLGQAAAGWGGVTLLASPGDLDGDGKVDLVARDDSGTVTLHRGAGNGTFGKAVRTYPALANAELIAGAGDLDADGIPDLVARKKGSGVLHLFRGRDGGALAQGSTISRAWKSYDAMTGAGDLTGDGRPDLLARAGKSLYLVPGKGAGTTTGLGSRVLLPNSWSGFDQLAGGADLTGDGIADLVVRSAATKLLHIYPGTGKGGFAPRLGGFTQATSLRTLVVAGQVAGTGDADVVGISEAGNLRYLPHNGRRNLGLTKPTNLDLTGTDLLLNVGDWNRDGISDLMTRTPAGVLSFRAGQGNHTFAPPVEISTAWKDVTNIMAVGDHSGDGHPDLLAVRLGQWYLYPGDGLNSFGKAARLETPPVLDSTGLYDWFLRPGDVDGDGRSDVVARAKADGYLWLLPGTPSGFGARRLIATGFDRYDRAG